MHVRVQRCERLEAGETVDPGKLHVEQDEVGLHAGDERKQVASVADLADELHLGVAVEHHPDGVAHQPMVIGENDLDRAHPAPSHSLPCTRHIVRHSSWRRIPRIGVQRPDGGSAVRPYGQQERLLPAPAALDEAAEAAREQGLGLGLGEVLEVVRRREARALAVPRAVRSPRALAAGEIWLYMRLAPLVSGELQSLYPSVVDARSTSLITRQVVLRALHKPRLKTVLRAMLTWE